MYDDVVCLQHSINSLGESMRFVMTDFGGKQLREMICHLSLKQLMDHF